MNFWIDKIRKSVLAANNNDSTTGLVVASPVVLESVERDLLAASIDRTPTARVPYIRLYGAVIIANTDPNSIGITVIGERMLKTMAVVIKDLGL